MQPLTAPTAEPMMRVSDLLTPASLIPDIQADTKADVLHTLAVRLALAVPDLDAHDVFNVLWEREELGSTGIEAGIAVPHGRLRQIARPILVVGRTRQPIDYDAIDEMKTDLFFALLAPATGGDHLRLLAQLARLFHAPEFGEQLRSCATADDMHRCILRWEAALSC